jgi:SAM-dependent methyltransferase
MSNKFYYKTIVIVVLILNKIIAHLEKYNVRFKSSDFQERMVIDSTSYDMVAEQDEPYYAEQYLKVIQTHLKKLPKNSSALDLGCGQGRLTMLLGELFKSGKVTACDLSKSAIGKAKSYASESKITNIDFRTKPISQLITECENKYFDVILFTEVTFFYPQWRNDFQHIVKLLKPGGILAVSFRSQYFNALYLVRERLWDRKDMLIKNREGNIFGDSSGIFTWQRSDEIRRFIGEHDELELLDFFGIGICSGIIGDPHGQICSPSKLSERERKNLMDIELELGRSVPDAGRYMLAIIQKKESYPGS